MADSATEDHFFAPSTQNAFWASFHPDIRMFLEGLEERESWTYTYEEFPRLFVDLGRALPQVVEVPLSDHAEGILRDLIPLLATMPLRQSMAGIAWLDARADGDDGGWGVVCYLYAMNLLNSENTDDPIYAHARILVDRIERLLRFQMASELFCHIHKVVKGIDQ